eukprot:7639665-Ditylum_brightwellii.AAC.1
MGLVFESLTLYNKVRVLKFQHNWLPTAEQLGKFYHRETKLCPICAQHSKTWQHLFQCKQDTARLARLHMIGKLCKGMRNMKTNPFIRT